MLDAAMRKLIDPPLASAATVLKKAGVSANAVTVTSFMPGLGAAIALGFGEYALALALILVNRLMDGLDGAVARQTVPTDLGGYLDIVGDFIFYGAVPFGFAVAAPEANALPAAFLLVSFIGTGSSFLAYAVVAEKRKITTDIRGKKSFYYLGGLTEGTETIVFFIACCLLPQNFPILAWIFGGLCWVTTLTRIAAAATTFRD
ncbi:CDP-alcohol phosphatidyltransferase family protein [Hwanghaeella sp.]|uniref:CDP-alcohol phosphatidyltransferase family protein n=1 Tax=Hwanghaeella sp. TaxID=2605943 RepID=UPI003CCBCB96